MDGMLSQEEINALLSGMGSDSSAPAEAPAEKAPEEAPKAEKPENKAEKTEIGFSPVRMTMRTATTRNAARMAMSRMSQAFHQGMSVRLTI